MRCNRIICRLAIGTTPGAVNGAEKTSKDGASRGFRELKEALKILESLKNMTVEQLWTGGSPTSPTSAEPASTAHVTTSAAPAATEKPTKEKRFLDDIKKLQENLRKTLDNVAIVEEEKMEAGGSAGAGTEVCLCSQFWHVESKLLMWVRYFKIISHNSVTSVVLLLFRQSEWETRRPSRSRRHLWVDKNGPVNFLVTHLYCASRVGVSLVSPSPVPKEKCSLCWNGHQVRSSPSPPYLLLPAL